MQVIKVSRTYSKSINTKTYGIPESWIKIEATYEAQCESGDDPIEVSKLMAQQAKVDVINNTNEVIEQIKKSLTPANTTGSTAVNNNTPRQL